MFVSFTCNPKWDEIANAHRFESGQNVVDRPDIVSRVFKMKLDALYAEVKNGTAFGTTRGALCIVEFQKRVLLHAHMLIWLDRRQGSPDQCPNEIPMDALPEFINGIVSAELPDPAVDPLAYVLVDEFMVHGPCGRMNAKYPCMRDGVCSKRWVVPHNVALLKRYQAHINVEWWNKTNLVKYMFKYITKGPDRANVVVHPLGFPPGGQDDGQGVDEVTEYISCWYLSACEAFWRLYSFDIHVRAPAVDRLEIHMPGMNIVTYPEDADLGDIVQNDNYRKSMLTEWFAMNRLHLECRELTYCEFPTKYTWYSDGRRWVRRAHGFMLGRIQHVSPSTGELFYMRMLLMAVRGAHSFEDLRRHVGVTHLTYRDACQARGLLGDDSEWACVFDETIVWAIVPQLRNLFVTILMFCDVGDAGKLFEKYWRYLVDDIVYIRRQALRNQHYTMPDNLQKTFLLKELGHLFSNNGGSLSSYNLPDAVSAAGPAGGNRLIFEETSYNKQELAVEWQFLHSRLNSGQTTVYDNGMIVLAIASSGVVLFCFLVVGQRIRALRYLLILMKGLSATFDVVLPAIHGATRAEIVDVALSSSPLWSHVKVGCLIENMWLSADGLTDDENAELSKFSDWVLAVGDGTLQAQKRERDSEATWMTIPDRFLIRTDGDRVDALIDSVYDDFVAFHASLEYH
ncbi:hypothetical protein ACQ4PT_019101 [Festuca glaucescens]